MTFAHERKNAPMHSTQCGSRGSGTEEMTFSSGNFHVPQLFSHNFADFFSSQMCTLERYLVKAGARPLGLNRGLEGKNIIKSRYQGLRSHKRE